MKKTFHLFKQQTKILIIVLLILSGLSHPNQSVRAAAEWIVESTADSGPQTLRQAVTDASAGDTIRFGSSLSGQTITLTSGEITINKNLVIDNSSLEEKVIITTTGANRVFYIPSEDISFSINNIKFSGIISGPWDEGGVIWSDGNLTVTNCIFENNNVAYGAIYSSNILNVLDSEFINNTTTTSWGSAAINVYNDTIKVVNSIFSGNKGPAKSAIYLTDISYAEFTGNTFTDNQTTSDSSSGSATLYMYVSYSKVPTLII